MLRNKRIVLGVTGSIACYKSVDLASKLSQAGALVDVILTASAEKFVSALSFHAVTGREVYSDMWSLESHIGHVRLGESADLFVIAPATANTIARLAHGLADNLLTLTALTFRGTLLVAPAMDAGMFEHPATQANVELLRERGVRFVGPAEGRMASGHIGLGRMVEPSDLVGHVRVAMGSAGPLAGKRVVVTAGPTREALDPVRFLTNRSSGKQGFALAQAAVDAGAEVVLISGPVYTSPPVGTKLVCVRTAGEMLEQVMKTTPEADVLLMAAAVADYRPAQISQEKIKKTGKGRGQLALTLEANPDILLAVKEGRAKAGKPRIVLGFAAETEDLVPHGEKKLADKNLDYIAINDVSSEVAGFEVDTNSILLLRSDGWSIEMPRADKTLIAEAIISEITNRLEELGD